MKILQVSDYHESGGNPLNYYNQMLSQRGHDVTLLTSTISLGNVERKSVSFKTEKIRGFKIWGKVFYPGLITKLLFKKDLGIVHSHVMGFFSTFVTGYLRYIKKYPLVVTADFEPASYEKPKKLKKIYELIYKKIPIKKADVILVFTENQKKELAKLLDITGKKIKVLPIGVDIAKFPESKNLKLKKELGLKGKFVVLNVGAVLPEKHIEILLKTIKLVGDDRVVGVHIGGFRDKECKKRLDEMVKKLNIEKRVFFLGAKKADEMHNYFSMADVYLQTSPTASFCIPIIESMAAKCLVVTFRAGVARDLIKDGKNGFFMEDEGVAAKKVNKIISDSELRKKIIKNAANDVKKYEWLPIIKELEKIYRDLYEKNKH
jgi:glycosyltransferase involved in cell wall biosynthesis